MTPASVSLEDQVKGTDWKYCRESGVAGNSLHSISDVDRQIHTEILKLKELNTKI